YTSCGKTHCNYFYTTSNPAGLLFAAGVVSKGNGDCFLMPESHTSLTKGGGQAGQGYPCVLTTEEKKPILCLNDQGGNVMSVTENIVGTLRAQEHGHQPIVMGSQQGNAEICVDLCPTITQAAGTSGNNTPLIFENHGIDNRYTGPLNVAPTISARYGTGGNNCSLVAQALFEGHGKDARYNGPLEVAPTISSSYGEGGGNTPLAMNIPHVFSLDSAESNSMKSANPTSGCRETTLARTIDTTIPCPSKNQGGLAIVQESYCIAGNIIDRQDHNGGNGCGFQADISYTLTGADRHAVYNRQGYSGFTESEVVGTQCARQYKDSTDLIATYQQTVGTLCSGDEKGIGNQYVEQDKCVIDRLPTVNLVRRLTPLECERLQGFPDYWTEIPKCSDSARYKALGNSVAIPCVEYVLRGIAYFLKKFREDENV
ncbi:MAG: DNA cytosine methyltransferase, partial [Christensenella sp.]